MEDWRPTPEEVLKGALDVAMGMDYLHTAFQVHLLSHVAHLAFACD